MPTSPTYKPDCRHFRGDIPCTPHKEHGVHCDGCEQYAPTDRNILIIKLGAIGDVLRTTPLLRRLRRLYPTARIWWITHTPEILPEAVDVKMRFDLVNVMAVLAINFDLLINLDKDREAAALADRVEASAKKGFIIRNGIVAPIDADAEHKFLTGIFDDVNRANKKNYIEEIFEICGYTWEREEYMLNDPGHFHFLFEHRHPIIGLNTGCGGRWTSRLWPDAYWEELIMGVLGLHYIPVLLGGEQEDSRNRMLSEKTGALYPGHFTLPKFISLMNECDVVVSAVTMAMHIAIGLRKPLILFNNIFNPHEFELYGRGEIIEPSVPCTCFFRPACINPDYQCMTHIEPGRVLEAVRLWARPRAS